jgi:hypothetical protein
VDCGHGVIEGGLQIRQRSQVGPGCLSGRVLLAALAYQVSDDSLLDGNGSHGSRRDPGDPEREHRDDLEQVQR